MKRLTLVAILGILIVLCLLVAAGPAPAGGPYLGDPPGFQWGGPHFNGKLVFTGDTTAEITVADPRGSGVLEFEFTDYAESVVGNTLYIRYVSDGTVTNAGGVWTYTDGVALASGPIKGHGSGMSIIGFACTATGGPGATGFGYTGLSYAFAWHSGTGMTAPFVFKGRIF